jgi:hypothetical protein
MCSTSLVNSQQSKGYVAITYFARFSADSRAWLRMMRLPRSAAVYQMLPAHCLANGGGPLPLLGDAAHAQLTAALRRKRRKAIT